MRILLIGNFVPDRQESMLRFSRLLEQSLRDGGHEVRTWSPEPRLVRLLPRYRYNGAAKFIGYFDKFVLFPRRVRQQLARGLQADVVHITDHANAVYGPLFAGRPLLATCHDLLQIRAAHGDFPQHRVSALGRRYQSWILESLAKLPRIVVTSHQTSLELRRLANVPLERTTVIPLALNYPYQPVPPAQARAIVREMLVERGLDPGVLDLDGRGYLMNIGGGQWYKNRRGVINIYAELRRRLSPPPKLLMVGKPLAPEIVARIQRLRLASEIVHVSNVSEAQLSAIYTLAQGLLFPSWHEGFGWPVAEAQACGCPVFTSDRAPMTEVGGEAGAYVPPGNPREAGRRIALAWGARDAMRACGLARAPQWNPGHMIARYLEVYRQAINAHAPAAA